MFNKLMSVLSYREQRKQTKNGNYFVKAHKNKNKKKKTGSFTDRHPFLITVLLIVVVSIAKFIFG